VEANQLLEELKAQGLKGKALFRALLQRGVPRNEAYRLALELEGEKKPFEEGG
jgi:16S rRNA (cytidine1402-2'-O)-methyltransferase